MQRKCLTRNIIIFAVLSFAISLLLTQLAITQDTVPKPKIGFNPFQMDPRAKETSYHFKHTDEDLDYCLFVSSKVSKEKKAPLTEEEFIEHARKVLPGKAEEMVPALQSAFPDYSPTDLIIATAG